MIDALSGSIEFLIGVVTLLALFASSIITIKTLSKSKEIKEEIQTKNGGTVGTLSEETAHRMTSIENKLDAIGDKVSTNTVTSLEAKIIGTEAKVSADKANTRLDDFFKFFHKGPKDR
jgi:hypothetical protein